MRVVKGIFVKQPYTCIFSIIIPTYNVESSIARCLDSCINQTLSDIEILIVDDCGSDASIRIAQAYADRDPRIRILHNKHNLGTFATRIVGVREARGEYVVFLDADDYLRDTACAVLYQHIAKRNVDILHFKAHYPSNPQAPLLAKLTHYARYILPTRLCKTPLHNEQIAYNFFLKSTQFPKFTLWDKCYKNDLLRQASVHFIDSSFTPIVADDMLFFLAIATLATSYISIDTHLYFYCLNTHSSMHSPSKKQRRINSFAYVANALYHLSHKLKHSNGFALQIAQTMSKYLCALIILESRFDTQDPQIARKGGGRDRICRDRCYRIYGKITAISAKIFTFYTNHKSPVPTYSACRRWANPRAKNPDLYTQNPITIPTILRPILAILESFSYLYPHFYVYRKLRQNQALATLHQTAFPSDVGGYYA